MARAIRVDSSRRMQFMRAVFSREVYKLSEIGHPQTNDLSVYQNCSFFLGTSRHIKTSYISNKPSKSPDLDVLYQFVPYKATFGDYSCACRHFTGFWYCTSNLLDPPLHYCSPYCWLHPISIPIIFPLWLVSSAFEARFFIFRQVHAQRLRKLLVISHSKSQANVLSRLAHELRKKKHCGWIATKNDKFCGSIAT